jgi:hypothetical protein
MKSYKEYQDKAQMEKENGQSSQFGATAEDLMKKIASAYNGKSDANIFRQILAQAEEGKRNGTLTNEEIENFYLTFSPMLSAPQKKRLRGIVNQLKEI